MVATIPFNRIGFDSPPAELDELPQSARGRGRLWSDTVFQAVLALKKQLTHRDAGVVAAAANSILELERTSMRHGKLVAGSEYVSDAQLEFEAEQREDRELSVERREALAAKAATAKKVDAAPAEGVRPNGQALAEHVREVTDAFEASGQPLPGRPDGYVRGLLKRWGLAANAIPKGGFTDHLRVHGIGNGPSDGDNR